VSEEAFVAAVGNLVAEWHRSPENSGPVPREQLARIYREVREEAVHDLALYQEQRDAALRLYHDNLMETGREARADVKRKNAAAKSKRRRKKKVSPEEGS
jgi:hypothetical protein